MRFADNLPIFIALMMTGLIWSRYSMVIIPKNYSLLAVNVFVFGTSAVQCGRIWR
jgi:long-chain acyl-CoA synthetase